MMHCRQSMCTTSYTPSSSAASLRTENPWLVWVSTGPPWHLRHLRQARCACRSRPPDARISPDWSGKSVSRGRILPCTHLPHRKQMPTGGGFGFPDWSSCPTRSPQVAQGRCSGTHHVPSSRMGTLDTWHAMRRSCIQYWANAMPQPHAHVMVHRAHFSWPSTTHEPGMTSNTYGEVQLMHGSRHPTHSAHAPVPPGCMYWRSAGTYTGAMNLADLSDHITFGCTATVASPHPPHTAHAPHVQHGNMSSPNVDSTPPRAPPHLSHARAVAIWFLATGNYKRENEKCAKSVYWIGAVPSGL